MNSKETILTNDSENTSNTGWEKMEYRKVNTKEYVEAGLADGSLEVFEAAKHARIGAVKGESGQEVISWSEDEDGNPIQEKVATVTADEETGETGWIATKTDAEGNPIVDKNGHVNQWIIDNKTFREKYEVDPEHPDIFKPVGGPQKFVETKEALTISQWGEEMNMPKGSFINITNPDDMYAINPRDFYDTYSRSGETSAAEAPAMEEPTTWDNIADKADESNSGITAEKPLEGSVDGFIEDIKQIDNTSTDGNTEPESTGWENKDTNTNDYHEDVNKTSESSETTRDNIGKKVPFQPKSNVEEHSSLDESKYEKDKERISEAFLDYSNILKVVFEASEEGMDYDLECSNNDEYLSRKIVENLRDISSISPTEDEDIWRFSIRDTIFIDVSRSTGDIQSVNKLTSFELRSLAQGKENGVPFSREKLTDFRPKTDLHTHFAGAITPDSLIEVGKKHNISYPAEYLAKAGVDVSKYIVDENGNIELSSVNDGDLDALKARLMISPVTQETFNKMEDIYALRGPFTKNKELFPDLLHSLAETYRDTGIEYAELSYSSFISDRDYMEMINQNVPEIEAETGVKLRFVAGLWRHSDKEWNMDDTDRIIGIARSPYIVGVDFMGHETNSTETFKDELQALAKYTMSEDPDFTIRVHAGENPMFKDNVKDTLRIIYDEHRAREEADGQEYPMPRVRIGHGLYGVDEETIQLAKEMGAIIEFNISSNLALNNINSIAEIPIKKYLDAGVDVVLGTDGGGLYSTAGEQEALLATAAGLEPEDFEKMRQTEAKVLAKATEREMSHPRLDDVNPLYDNVVYSTPDGQPRYSRAVSERYAAEKAEAARQLDERLEKIGIITNSEEVEKATDGKIPVMITGASKSNWPNITPKDQRNIALTMQVLADVLNPDTTFIVTGGTNFGVEKTMHEAVHRRNESNPDDPIVLLGTLTMEATREENGGVEPNTITHATILEHDGRKAENWMDLPDTQLEYVKDKDGCMIAVGGGGVVNDMIQRGYNLDVDMQLMDGPYGASTNKSRSLAGNDYSFKTVEDLVRRLYAKNPAMFADGFSIDDISSIIQRAEREISTT